jgi:AraC-like DNA-binding protein
MKDQAMESQLLRVLRWLKVFTGANTSILLGFLVVVGLYLFQQDIFGENATNLLPTILLGASFFLICAYLLIHPQVLIGLPFVGQTKSNLQPEDQEDNKTPFCVENYAQEIAILGHYFVSSKAYLKPNLTISEVAVATGLPVRELSYLINAYHKKRFSDYLNEMRLDHFLTQVDTSTLDNFTIESIALSAGFSSRSSFYRAFNRFFGCTPSDYLRGNIAK